MFRYSDIICELGSALVNEDAACITQYGAWVLDGATGLNKKNYVDEISDARWFTAWWNSYLQNTLNSKESLVNIIKNGILQVKKEFIRLANTSDLNEIDMPSCSFVLIRWNIKKAMLEYFSLGDCMLTFNQNGTNTVICDEKLISLDTNVLNQLGQLTRNEGLSHACAKEKLMPLIISNRELKNKPNGYYILGFDENAAQNASYGEIKIENNLKVLLASDGFSALYEKYKYISLEKLMNKIEATGLRHYYQVLRDIENKDMNTALFPRFKQHDDSSAVFRSF